MAPRLPPARDRPADGIAGALCARSEAHTIRLALLYALADGQRRSEPGTSKPHSPCGTTPPAPPAWALRRDRRSARRTDPRRHQPSRRTDPQPDLKRSATTGRRRNQQALQALQLAGRASRPRPHRRPPRGAVDRHHTGGLTTPTPSPDFVANPRRTTGLSPSAARGRERSDLDSHVAGATTLQVRGGERPPPRQDYRRLLSFFRSPHRSRPNPSPESRNEAALNKRWLGLQHRERPESRGERRWDIASYPRRGSSSPG